MKILVFGHVSPDTDSIASALVYTWYLNQQNQPAEAYRLGEINKETAYVLDLAKISAPKLLNRSLTATDFCAIVDTNNALELPDSISVAKLHSIIDHHKLSGNLETSGPILVNIQPLACTATILWELIEKNYLKVPRSIQILCLCAILSDTLGFRSPTTTDKDQKIAKKLAKNLELKWETVAEALFLAKSDLSDLSAKEILLMDSKLLEKNDQKIRLSVCETTDPASILSRKAEILLEMSKLTQKSENLRFLFFIVDIFNQKSILLVTDETSLTLAESAFSVKINENEVQLPKIISRKKQIVPKIKKYF